jgi:hypothetical protein
VKSHAAFHVFVAVVVLASAPVPTAAGPPVAKVDDTVRVTRTATIGTTPSPSSSEQLPHQGTNRLPGASSAGARLESQIEGRLVEIDKESITVLRQKERLRFRRDEIGRLEVQKGRTRGRNALLGAGIGLVVGLAWAAVENSRCQGEFLCGVEFAAYPILTVPAGALVGVAIPGNRRWVDGSAAGAAMLPPAGVRVAWSIRF